MTFLKLNKELTNTTRRNFLPHRINNVWNDLPTHVKGDKSVNKFKQLIETTLKECVL